MWFIYWFTTLDSVNLYGAHYSNLCLAVPQKAKCVRECVCVCVRGREKISQCGSKNLAQVLLLWLIFRWQGLSGASLPSCQHLTSLPPLLSIPSAFSLLLVLSFSSPFFCHPVKDQEQLLSPGSSCLLALFSSIQQTVKNQFVPLFFFSIKGKILSLCSSCSKSV